MRADREPESEDELRRGLARLGVPLFAPTPDGGPDAATPGEIGDLVLRLASSADARLQGALPCLLARQDADTARTAVLSAAAGAEPPLRRRIGRLYRLARSLVLSRAPDLERLLGRAPRLDPVPLEPSGGIDPGVRLGEAALAEESEAARCRGEPDLAGGVARTFDTWLRLLSAEQRHARA